MKKLLLILFSLLNLFFLEAQAPQSFKYQAIARNVEGDILSNRAISLRISILLGSNNGHAVYSEIHNTSTSPFGLLNLEIGNGKTESGEFSAIDWSRGKYYVNIEIDVNGGSDFVSMGSSQLLSVPYALYAEKSGASTDSATGKAADSWTEGTGVTYLTNPNNVGVGTTAPASKLHVTGSGINAVYERNISTAAGPANRFYKSRGSESSKTQIQAGDNMGQFQFWGMGDDGSYDIGATLKGVAESTRTGTDIFDVAASIQFLTTNTSFSWGERMRITADGYVGIGTTAPAGILDIAGAYHFPNADGTIGQVLNTDGSGTLSWSDAGAKEINDLSDGRSLGNSVFLGDNCGDNDDGTDNRNVGVGRSALYSNTSGYLNTAIGAFTLFDNVSGYYNTAIGSYAMNNNTSGNSNTSIGNNSLEYNTSGSYNTAGGKTSLYYNLGGSNNTAFGMNSLFENTNGNSNTAVGANALSSNTTGTENSSLGYMSMFNNTTGLYNTAVGCRASYQNTTSDYNTVVGYEANYNNQAGSENTIVGYQAGRGSSLHSKSGNVFLGHKAGYYEENSNKLYIDNSSTLVPLIYGEFDNDLLRVNGTLHIKDQYHFPDVDGSNGQILKTNGSGTLYWSDAGAYSINGLWDARYLGGSVYLGYMAGEDDDGVSNNNVGVGEYALHENTSGRFNLAMGKNALLNNTNGNDNVAIGYVAMSSNTTGLSNIAVGSGALWTNTTGNNNIAIGLQALYDNTWGGGNVAIGYKAQNKTTYGGGNTTLGHEANYNNVTGNFNTIIGYKAGYGAYNQSINNNVFIGYMAGYSETGDNKLYIENSSSTSPLIYGEFDNDIVAINGSLGIGTNDPEELLHVSGGKIKIGSAETIEDGGTNILAFNANLVPASDGLRALGTTSKRWSAVWAVDGTINTSDKRDKENIYQSTYGLNEIMQMDPVSFTWKDKPYQGEKLGLIAQDLQKIIPEVVKSEEWVSNEETGKLEKHKCERLGIYYSDLIPVLIKGMQEQQEIIEELKARIEELEDGD